MMKPNKFILPLLIFLLTSCGFKLSNLESNYNIVEINASGDNQINYKLKNKLLLSSKKNSQNQLKLNINTNMQKTIKEKNISNQINKYSINIVASVNYKDNIDNLNNSFTISKNADYNISSNYLETINREKNIINLLINEISDEIIENFVLKFNDL